MSDDLEADELIYPAYGERDRRGEPLWCEHCGAAVEEGVPHAADCPFVSGPTDEAGTEESPTEEAPTERPKGGLLARFRRRGR